MFSKRLTANILTSSNDSRSRLTAAVPSKSFPCDGVQVMSGRNFNLEIEHAPRSMDARDKPALHVETQCAMAKMGSTVADLSKEELSKGEYAINLLDFGDSLSRSTAIGPIQKRTHSADSRTQRKTEQLCINCQNKLFMTETIATESHDPNSLQAEIIIRRSSDVDLFETSHSTRTSIHRQSFFSRDSGKRLSGSFDSLKSQSLTMKCAMCHTNLTSGDLTTSIRTSTSSLLGSEAVINMSLKEVAEAYVRICRTAGQFDGSAATKDRASLYQALKHNRIIQAVIADYEKEKNVEGKFIVESKEIADVVAMTDKEIGYCVREPSTYSNLRNNTLVKKVVESYETYKCKQRTDICTQTDQAQMKADTFPNSDVKEIAEVVGAFEKSQGQVSTKMGLYADLKGNPIIQRVIEEYELNRGVYSATKPSATIAEAVLPSAAALKMGILSVDGQVAKMESEQFASTRLSTQNSCAIIRKVHKSKAEEKTISSSVSSDSEDEDYIQNWRRTQCSPASLEECIRFDVACSALITPETWDKKIQVDLTYNH
ncbi:unnamed protein product [Hydatigera taeniaeformis]|uniref:Breast cancer type 2 susceptibility protein homolog n=1 Tax=Hydatigena taeniaeformis TaxID=6205 RepID=A0A0R3WTW3_HYDTA|nr:unnamed protein product [Hydatigera taeniaeformis]